MLCRFGETFAVPTLLLLGEQKARALFGFTEPTWNISDSREERERERARARELCLTAAASGT